MIGIYDLPPASIDKLPNIRARSFYSKSKKTDLNRPKKREESPEKKSSYPVQPKIETRFHKFQQYEITIDPRNKSISTFDSHRNSRNPDLGPAVLPRHEKDSVKLQNFVKKERKKRALIITRQEKKLEPELIIKKISPTSVRTYDRKRQCYSENIFSDEKKIVPSQSKPSVS